MFIFNSFYVHGSFFFFLNSRDIFLALIWLHFVIFNSIITGLTQIYGGAVHGVKCDHPSHLPVFVWTQNWKFISLPVPLFHSIKVATKLITNSNLYSFFIATSEANSYFIPICIHNCCNHYFKYINPTTTTFSFLKQRSCLAIRQP